MNEIELIQPYYVLLHVILTLSVLMLLVACLWCKKKVPKNELLGLEGMVKLKNPDEVVVLQAVGTSESQADLNLSTISNADSEKRASTAAHRSLPDIPAGEANGDTGSELYETVADKRLIDAQADRGKSPSPSLKKQTSVSQHSSISQADDVSSPYSRVKNSPHDYAKVRSTEHPYAQLNPPSTSAAAAAAAAISGANTNNNQAAASSDHRSSRHSGSSHNLNDDPPQAEIPAASAIAGMISASQDLPYMTPPIANQHFSGDSQDSSKGYTSISVREPLANILAQQQQHPSKSMMQRNAALSRDVNDSHYATVSDDSDETYAAIEDPNMRNNPNSAADIYTSGSETYAQIQPMQSSNSIVVSVEINNTSVSPVAPPSHSANNSSTHLDHSASSSMNTAHVHVHNRASLEHVTPIPPPVDSLRAAQMHSRQASSSSNNSSSVGNLGSPKPEKRQANSPLPPTPKSNLTSGRNSVISVIEAGGGLSDATSVNSANSAAAGITTAGAEISPQKKNKSLSPSKDIEGMYAKVMKKNKFSRHSPSSQNSSPVLARKYNSEHAAALGVSPLDSAAAELIDAHKISISASNADKSRTRSNSYGAKDHGYETIPADGIRGAAIGMENRKSDCYTNILQKERQLEGAHLPNASLHNFHTNAKPPIDSDHSDKHYETIASPNSTNNSDPGYETLLKPKINQSDPDSEKKSSDYDPNYEVLKGPKYISSAGNTNSAGLSDDGYAKVLEKKRLNIDEDSVDGYSKVKGEDVEDGAIGYSTIGEMKATLGADANHNYASILETKVQLSEKDESDHYARIAEALPPPPATAAPDLPLSSVLTPVKAGEDANAARALRLPELPITSPSSLNSSSLLNNSSTISSLTNATFTSTSTSTMSSTRQTPTSSSQYESLTGSDTDPNYESVCYLNKGSENPYERLQTDFSDTQLSSPLTPEERSATPKVVAPATNGSKLRTAAVAADTSTGDVVVDDYFQV